MMQTGATAALVAGFEPFGGRGRNRSLDVVQALGRKTGVETTVLPVDFGRLEAAVAELAGRKPAALLLIGESPRPGVAIEQVALNIVDASLPDNAGMAPKSQIIDVEGPLARRANWDAQAVVRTLKASGIPAEVSFHAGTYACNAALYLALRQLPAETPVGFMHVNKWRWPRGVRLSLLISAAAQCLEALRQSA